MVRINSIVLAGLAAVGAIARPAKSKRDSLGLCMTDEQAQFVAHNYGTLIANYTDALANQVLAVNFTDYAESVNTLINECPQGSAAISLPLLDPTFTSREQFEIGQGQQPAINFDQLNIWTSCDAVVIRWMTTNTAPIPNPKPVVGLIAMEVIPNDNLTAAVDYPWLIDTVYSEFDSGAWLQNLKDAGICPSDCTSTSTSASATASATASSTASVVVDPVVSSTATSVADASSSATLVASATTGVGSGDIVATSTVSSDVTVVTSTMVVVVNPDGSVTEEPCEEE